MNDRAWRCAFLFSTNPLLWGALLLLLTSIANCTGQTIQPQPANVFDQTIVVQLTETGKETGKFYARIQAAPVRAGTQNRFILKIHNPGAFSIEFDEIAIGCPCLKINLNSNQIPPGGWVEAVLDYTAPTRQRSETFVQAIFLKQAGEIRCSLNISGQLEGLLEILGELVIESNGAFSNWQIPILSSSPVNPSRLRLHMPDQFRDLQGKIEIVNGQAVIAISGPERALGMQGISGDVTVEDPTLGVKATARLTILKRPKVRISPKIVTLEKIEGSPNRYQANFIVQTFADLEIGEERVLALPKNTIQEIECHSEFGQTTCKTIKLSDSLCRVNLELTTRRETPDESKLTWEIRTPEGAFSLGALALFPRE